MSYKIYYVNYWTMAGFLVICAALPSGSCRWAQDNTEKGGRNGVERDFQICPPDLVDDVVGTLELGQVYGLTLEELTNRSNQLGFSHHPNRYGRHPTNQCPGIQDLDSDTMVLRIRAGRDKTNRFGRSFIVVSDDSNRVTHIEARYTHEPP